MSTTEEAVLSLIGIAVSRGAIRICYRFYKGVAVFLVFHDVMTKASHDCFVLSLGLAVSSRMVSRSDEVLNTKQGT